MNKNTLYKIVNELEWDSLCLDGKNQMRAAGIEEEIFNKQMWALYNQLAGEIAE